MNTSRDFFFHTPILPSITDLETPAFVGIDNVDPSCTLDVGGNLKAMDINVRDVNVRDILADDMVADGIISHALQTTNLVGSNIVGSNIVASHNMASCNVTACNVNSWVYNVGSNLYINGFSLHEPCPNDANQWIDLLPFQDDQVGFIHESWLIRPRTAASVLGDLFDIAEKVGDWAERLQKIYDWLKPTPGLPDNPYWDWDKIKNRPIASKGENIGFNDDIFVSDEAKLKVCPENKFTKGTLTGITDFNFIVDNLPVDPSGDTLMDFGTREMTMSNFKAKEDFEVTSSNLVDGIWAMVTSKEERYANLTPQGISLSNATDFKIGDWSLGSNTIGNSNSPDSSFQFNASNILTHFATINTSSQFFPSNSKHSFLYQYEDALEFHTQDNLYNNNGETPPVKIQFSVDSNGTLYTRSNILMQDMAIIRGYVGETIDQPYKEGLLKVSPTNLMFSKVEKTAGQTTLNEDWFSVNASGLWLAKRAALFGKVENFLADAFLGVNFTSYPRLELGVENGLRYGYGASNNPLGGTYDVFKVGYKGQISTLNHNNMLMREIVNDKAEVVAPIKIGSLQVATDGTLTIGKLKINPVGNVYLKLDNFNYELIISTVRQFKADAQSKAYTTSAFKL